MPNGFINPRGRTRLGGEFASNRDLTSRDLNDYERIKDVNSFQARLRKNKSKKKKIFFESKTLSQHIPSNIPSKIQEKLWNFYKAGGQIETAIKRGYKREFSEEMWVFYQRKIQK